jgi:hypothetical protein
VDKIPVMNVEAPEMAPGPGFRCPQHRSAQHHSAPAVRLAPGRIAAAACHFEPKFGWHHSAFDLVTVIRSKSIDEWRRPVIARMRSGGGDWVALWKGVAEAWVRAGNSNA